MSKADGLTSNYVSNISSWFWSHDKKKKSAVHCSRDKEETKLLLGKKKKNSRFCLNIDTDTVRSEVRNLSSG